MKCNIFKSNWVKTTGAGEMEKERENEREGEKSV